MSDSQSILEAYKQSKYQLNGHGPRNIQVLKEAFESIDDQLASDLYGQGQVIEGFQDKAANYLGKESAVFFPSGTIAQQIALRIWCDQKGNKKVAYHPTSHLELHEEDGLKELHHIEAILLADQESVIQLEDVVNLKEDIACLLLELPQREIGGQLPDYKTLVSISEYCRENGIKLHLDGARLYEILPHYQKTAAEVCSLFDSVYISFYKGIGGIAGAILAGNKEFTKESKVWKRRYGGDLISLYPYIISADYYFEQRIYKMEQYYQQAKEFAQMFNTCEATMTKPVQPVSNMFHVHFALPKDKLETILLNIYEETGIGLTGNLRDATENSCYYEVSVGDMYEKVPKEDLQHVFKLLNERIKGVK
ncbi:low specificity L-threonine aldolase [Bacillus sp. HMF5848]|uniref:threonine aldolase family protein n=1 Tax=Bacillus sp. HMF5848 TaxID=2495421 RepID=UPI000F7A8A54|nr:beta-eliminating lyase-related protein [Bacillus sp. HMF5848]RSK26092.1 low specificity L-threonine aldolase [Bacillus sp. HMF5848]